MIVSANGYVKIEGDGCEVLADIACILRSFYQAFSDEFGKEIANEKLIEIGRLAVITDEELREELKKKD